MYQCVLVYTSMYTNDIFIIHGMWVQTSMYWYILVCTWIIKIHTGIYQYIQLHTSTYWYMPHIGWGIIFILLRAMPLYTAVHTSIHNFMESHVQPNTSVYRLVHVYRILTELSINCHKTCMNCYDASSYQFYWHSMANSLRILYTWTQWYKKVLGCTHNSMTFHEIVYGGMYCLVPWHCTLYLPRKEKKLACQSAGQVLVHHSIYKYVLVCTALYSHVLVPWHGLYIPVSWCTSMY